MKNQRPITVIAMTAAAIATIIVWGPWPLGVPTEWVWKPISGSAVTLVVAILIALVGAVVVLGVDKLASRYAASSRWKRFLWAMGLAVVAFAWLATVREPIDWLKTAAGRSRDPWVLYMPGASGYYTAATEVESRTEFLSGYDEFVAEGDFLHQGTHPPGLILAYWHLRNVVQALPFTESLALGAMSSASRNSMDIISETQSAPLTNTDKTVLWYAAIFTQAAVAFCVVPLLFLLKQMTDAATAWRLASLWLFVPAAAVFVPKSDCLYPFVGLCVASLWVRGLKGSRLAAFLSGWIASYGLLLSLAIGPLLAGIASGTLYWAATEKNQWRRVGMSTGVAVAGGITQLIPVLLGGLNIVAVWLGNLKNHATFYDHNPRTFLAWLPVNFIEGTLAAGLPIVAVAMLIKVFARRRTNETERCTADGDTNGITRLVGNIIHGVLIAWLLLLLSGKNMGEAARLWILFTPWPILKLGQALSTLVRQTDSSAVDSPEALNWTPLAIASVLAFIAIVLRVDGFDLSGTAIGL